MGDESGARGDGVERGGRRRRPAVMIGTAAVLVSGLVGVTLLAATGGDDGGSADDHPVVTTEPVPEPDPAPDPEQLEGADPPETVPDDMDDTDEPADPVPASPDEVAEDVDPFSTGGQHPLLEEYLAMTDLVVERDVDGAIVVVRRSSSSYGELFDLDWDLPTGSFEECLGQPVVFVGSPEGGGWQPFQLTRSDGPVAVTPVWFPFAWDGERQFFVVASDVGDAVEIRVGSTTLDRSSVQQGLALVEIEYGALRSDAELSEAADNLSGVTIVALDGGSVVGSADPWQYGPSGGPCDPPIPPRPSLPEAGEQPTDPAGAEAEILAKHAALVSQDPEVDLSALLDDATGVVDAVDAMRSGPYADSAAGAEHTIDGFVFVAPDEAYFEYTIDAPTGVYTERFGRAVSLDGEWRITRATICQDLALAGGACLDDTGPIRPGGLTDEEMAAWYEANSALQQRYWEALMCHPLNPCWSPRLPEPGLEPDDADEARATITEAIVALVDLSTPIADELALLDDAEGVVEAAAALMESGLVSAARAEVREIVFTTADEAWVEFDVLVVTGALGDGSADASETSFGSRFGRAVRIDGEWLITRGTMCDLLALGSRGCEPAWIAEVPPN